MTMRTFDIFADPWTYLVLREIFFRVRRFEDIRRNLEISRKTLTERLGELVDAGLLEKRPYLTTPPRHEYWLTEIGIDFYPAIISLMLWGDRWRSRPVNPLTLWDRRDGSPVEPFVACNHCRRELKVEDIRPVAGALTSTTLEGFTGVLRRSGASASYLRGRPCSVASTLAVIGDRWSIRIVRRAFLGARRFDDFVADLGIARNILSARLNKLEADGVVERLAYEHRPPRYLYRLTPAGEDLIPPILMMMAWAERWTLRSSESAVMTLRHTSCQAVFKPVLLDRVTGREINARNVVYQTSYRERIPSAPDGSRSQWE